MSGTYTFAGLTIYHCSLIASVFIVREFLIV